MATISNLCLSPHHLPTLERPACHGAFIALLHTLTCHSRPLLAGLDHPPLPQRLPFLVLPQPLLHPVEPTSAPPFWVQALWPPVHLLATPFRAWTHVQCRHRPFLRVLQRISVAVLSSNQSLLDQMMATAMVTRMLAARFRCARRRVRPAPWLSVAPACSRSQERPGRAWTNARAWTFRGPVWTVGGAPGRTAALVAGLVAGSAVLETEAHLDKVIGRTITSPGGSSKELPAGRFGTAVRLGRRLSSSISHFIEDIHCNCLSFVVRRAWCIVSSTSATWQKGVWRAQRCSSRVQQPRKDMRL